MKKIRLEIEGEFEDDELESDYTEVLVDDGCVQHKDLTNDQLDKVCDLLTIYLNYFNRMRC